MKKIRPVALGLMIIFGLITAGCAIRMPSDAAQSVAAATTEQAAPVSGVETEPLTVTTALTMTTVGGAAEKGKESFFNLATTTDGYVVLSPEQLHQILPEHKFTLVDVHIPYQGELPDTDLFIPFDKIADHQAELPAKDAPIVLYCKTGPMSVEAAKTLTGLGYGHIYILKGGFDAWGAAKYELLKKK